ncbi:hypothetical protein RirG_208400 [Rhizophagus irregularis DAOM 197198w]|uniref:Uncharacterized protein n=2 Tax=Rhizophagus irregularis TaxID=588596 RepID=A0A015ISQ8_RHIIW|nr:hypothetical protein RirG_208400 [Rhizophagus irregularis DAOM 197198w]
MEIKKIEHDTPYDIFVWIPYDQFDNIKETRERDYPNKVFSAIWKNAYDYKYCKIQNKSVTLKCLNITNEFINKVKEYSIKCRYSNVNNILYGISQNPNTKDYFMVFFNEHYYEKWDDQSIISIITKEFCVPDLGNNFTNRISEYRIKEIQLIMDSYEYINWIPYNQFNYIKEIGQRDFDKVYSAIWKNGSLYNRDRNEIITLKCLYNSQSITNGFVNVVRAYTNYCYSRDINIYGISRNLYTKDYIMVFPSGYFCEKCGDQYTNIGDKWCKTCLTNDLKNNFVNWTSGNKEIDKFIQKIQLKIDLKINFTNWTCEVKKLTI